MTTSKRSGVAAGEALVPRVERTAIVSPGRDPILGVSVFPELMSKRELDIRFTVSFTPHPIPQGTIVKSECYIACTGARFELSSDCGTLIDVTQSQPLQTDHIVKTGESNRSSLPGLKLASGSLQGVGLSGGSVEKSLSRNISVSFSHHEALLASTVLDERTIRWSLASHRGEKAVRDFLEGNVTIAAKACWSAVEVPTLILRATPRRSIPK